jgi:hypothetical protein
MGCGVVFSQFLVTLDSFSLEGALSIGDWNSILLIAVGNILMMIGEVEFREFGGVVGLVFGDGGDGCLINLLGKSWGD